MASGILGTTHSGVPYELQRASNRIFITIPISASSVDSWVHVFEAGREYELISIAEIHTVAGSDAGAVTLDVKSMPNSTNDAPSTGRTLLSSTFNLKSAANTTVKKAVGSGLTATQADRNLVAGDKIGLDFTGTLTDLAGGLVTIELAPI